MSQVDSANVSDMFFLFFYSKENVFMKGITSLALGCTFFYEALMPHKATLYHPIQIQHLNNAKNKCTAAQVSCYHIKKSNGFAQQNNIKWDLQSICLLRCLKYLLPSEGIFKIFRLSLADFTFYRQIILKKKSDHFQQFFYFSMKMSFFTLSCNLKSLNLKKINFTLNSSEK